MGTQGQWRARGTGAGARRARPGAEGMQRSLGTGASLGSFFPHTPTPELSAIYGDQYHFYTGQRMRRVNAGSPGASPPDPVARNSQSLSLHPRSSPAGTRPSLLPRSPLPHAANPHTGAVPRPLAPGGARPAWKGLFTVQSHDVCAREDAVESWKITEGSVALFRLDVAQGTVKIVKTFCGR